MKKAKSNDGKRGRSQASFFCILISIFGGDFFIFETA